MGEIPQKPVDGHWYEFDQPAILLPGYDARLEIVPTAVLYPSLGTDRGNLVAIAVRVVTEEVSTRFQWDDTIAEFSVLYENLKAFPAEKSGFEFPTQVSFFGGAGVHVRIEPIGIHGWQVQCKLGHGHDAEGPDRTRSTVQVRFRLNVTDMQARQQTADFLRFVASLANEGTD